MHRKQFAELQDQFLAEGDMRLGYNFDTNDRSNNGKEPEGLEDEVHLSL